MRVVAIVGLPGSGKSAAASVAEDAGIPVVTMGDVIRDVCRERGLELTEDNLGTVATELREEGGDAAVAERALPLIEKYRSNEPVVLVDGIRGIAEVELFTEEFGDEFFLVSIDVPFETRLERIQNRGRDPTAETVRDLKRRDRRERGYGMDAAMASADRTIENTGGLDEFEATIRSILLEEPPEIDR